jgi:hypothetical protein
MQREVFFMTTANQPAISDAIISAVRAFDLTPTPPDILKASYSDELEQDPEGVFCAWLRNVPGAQEAAPALLDALQGRMEQETFSDVATYAAAINAFWALRAAMAATPEATGSPDDRYYTTEYIATEPHDESAAE